MKPVTRISKEAVKKKKIVKSDLLLSLGRKRTWIFACRARKAAPLEGFGLAAEKSPCGPLVW